MNAYPHTATSLAAELGISPRTVREHARPLGLGINIKGRAGYRFSEADRQALIDSLKPPAPVKARRKRRVA
jgi:biotin operon repressor